VASCPFSGAKSKIIVPTPEANLGNARGKPDRGAAPDPGAVSDSDALADLSGSAALRAELGEVAKLRAMATADRSYVAAEKFLRTERELRASIRDVRAREEAEATDSDDALLTELREALGSLPDSLLMRALATVRVDVLEHAAAAAGVAPTTTH